MLSCKECNAECCKNNDLMLGTPCKYLNLESHLCSIYEDIRERPMECWAYPYKVFENQGITKVYANNCSGNPVFILTESLAKHDLEKTIELCLELKDAFIY